VLFNDGIVYVSRKEIKNLSGQIAVILTTALMIMLSSSACTTTDNAPTGNLKTTQLSAQTVSNEQELSDAIADASIGVLTVITLANDITLSDNKELMILPGLEIVLTGNAQLVGADGYSTLAVCGNLTIDGITVTHAPGATGRGVQVGLFNDTDDPYNGNLTLISGEISGNSVYRDDLNGHVSGGGVLVTAGSTFTMSGGTVSGNAATSGAGVCAANHSMFTLADGTISDNIAEYSGAGVDVDTGSIFVMSGGAISNNTFTADSESYGWIPGNAGGGISTSYDCLFIMHSGAISNNSAQYGGGVYSAGIFRMSGGTISDNIASRDGGGVNISGIYVANNEGSEYYAIFYMYGGTISHNTATEQGGGVSNSGHFCMNGGVISENVASNGGGLAVNSGGVLGMTPISTINNGIVSDNVASKNGGGVYVDDLQNLKIAESAKFSGNEASQAYLLSPEDTSSYAFYQSNIYSTNWSNDYQYGYNNLDINYSSSLPLN
jgi:hypothetical protein